MGGGASILRPSSARFRKESSPESGGMRPTAFPATRVCGARRLRSHVERPCAVRALWRSCEGRGPRAPTPHPRSVLAAPRAPPRVRVPPTLACKTNRHLWWHHGLSPNRRCVDKGAVRRVDRVFPEREAAYLGMDIYSYELTEIGGLPRSGLCHRFKYCLC